MEVQVIINLSKNEETELAKILNSKKSNLSKSISPYASASVEEFITMFLGQKVFNRGSDIMEYRVFLLIKHAFNGRIPDEQEVSKLFQTTTTGSRSLIRAVMSKYQYQLKSIIDSTLTNLLENSTVSDERNSYLIAVHNLNLVEELNRELAEIDTNLPPVQKMRGSVSTYQISPSSYNKLCEKFNINPKPLDENE